MKGRDDPVPSLFCDLPNKVKIKRAESLPPFSVSLIALVAVLANRLPGGRIKEQSANVIVFVTTEVEDVEQ